MTTEISCKIIVEPGAKLSTLLSKTERFISGDFGPLGFVPEITGPSERAFKYIQLAELLDFDSVLALCEMKSLKPAHPAILASACLARPDFTDTSQAYTFWPTRNNLFGYTRYYKFRSREINIDKSDGKTTLEWLKGSWLATVEI